MITPTLFVGLGTTGTEILMKLRELMYEEYGLGGLPIFRYIAIETDERMETKLENTNQMKEYERINFIKASVDNFEMINRKLHSKDTLYNEDLDKWLNRKVLTFAKNFTTGAGHIRMAGRLCLWENWDELEKVLPPAQGAIIAPASINTTNDILEKHFNTKDIPIDENLIGGNTHIYIVGSLCGGTCSGMLIDMAYYCRGLIEMAAGNEIHGMFTMFDRRAANTAAGEDESLTKVRSANCYGGLWELNYYNHPKTTYDVVLPNNANKGIPKDKIPYDDIMLVSCSGKNPDNQFVDENGKLDLDGLNLMVALNLFAESVGNTRGLKAAMGINGQALDGYGNLKKVRIDETTVMMRNMASFGLTAVWYPKYRIANATASLVGQKVCENWLDSHIQEATIINDAEAEWRRIHDGNIEKLTSPIGLPSIQTLINEHLDKVKQARFNKNVSGAALNRYLEDFPKDDSFKQKFAEGGQYIELMKMQVPECQKAFRNAIEDTFNNQLGRIDFENARGIDDVEMFFIKLDDEIGKEIDNCDLQLPTLSLDELNFEQLDRIGKSFWLWSLWLQDESVESHQRDIISKYCDLIGGSEDSFYLEVQKYFLRPILEDIRAELGFGVLPKDIDAPNRRPTIKERLNKIKDNLNICIDQFEDQYNEAINPKKSECVKIVTSNNEDSIAEDAKIRSHQIITDGGNDELLDGTTMTGFLQKEHQEIFNQITTTYRSATLRRIRSDDVVTEVQKYVEARDPEITNLAQRSNPYQTFDTNNYQPLLGAPPKIIFGRDSTGNVLPTLEGRLGFSNSDDCSVEHLLLFYQEEYGFTIDDLRVFPILEDTYFENPLGEYGHSTNQDRDFYDLELHEKIDKLQEWCRVLYRLVPEICKNIEEEAFSDVLRPTTSGYAYEYHVDNLPKRLSLQDNKEGIKTLSQKLYTDHYNNFFKRVRTCFAELERSKVEKLTASILAKIGDNVQHERLGNIYRQFINDVYSDNAIDDELEDDIDAHFYEQTPHPQEEDTTEESTDAEPDKAKTDTDETVDDPTDETDEYDEVISEEDE